MNEQFYRFYNRVIKNLERKWYCLSDCQLSKSAYFFAIKVNSPLEKLTKIYINEVIWLHSISKISNRDPSLSFNFKKIINLYGLIWISAQS